MVSLDYQLALTSVPFDNTYRNVLRFDTRQEQEAHFKNNVLFLNRPKVNFNTGALIQTNVVYDCLPTDDLNTLLNQNYLIVKDNSKNAKLNYYYYFVTNATQLAGERIQMAIELDIFQTYYIDLNFTNCLINKAHLNRFIDNQDGTVSFDGRPESLLFSREEIQNVAKRLTKRTSVSLYPDTELGNWFKANVLGWLYLYLDPTHEFTFQNIKINAETYTQKLPKIVNTTKVNNNGTAIVPSNICVLCFPILSQNHAIILESTGNPNMIWGNGIFPDDAVKPILDIFTDNNNGYAYVYSIKFSAFPPITNYNVDYSIDSTYLHIQNCEKFNETYINPLLPYNKIWQEGINSVGNSLCIGQTRFYLQSAGPSLICYSLITANSSRIQCSYICNKQLIFNKNEIVGENKDPKFNPKLLNSDYFDISISDHTENGFKYDFQKLNKTALDIEYTEPLTPDFTKKYIRFKNLNGVYINETSQNLTGFINTNDATLLMPTSAYQNMIAGNKNFFLQNSISRGFNAASGIANVFTQAITGNIFGAIGTAIGTGANYAQSKINQDLTIDNMQNAPANIEQAKGNIIFETAYSPVGVIVEEHDILDAEKQQINDYMCLYGYSFNRVGNIKDYDNIRKFYNYIRADIEQIDGLPISNAVHDKFIQIFRNGVRMWNTDTFDYSKENYERWLENE